MQTRFLGERDDWVSAMKMNGDEAGKWGWVPRLYLRPLPLEPRDVEEEVRIRLKQFRCS